MAYEYERRFQNTEDTRKVSLFKIQVEALRTRLADDARDLHDYDLTEDMKALDGYLADMLADMEGMLRDLGDDTPGDEHAVEASMQRFRSGVYAS